MTRQRLDQLLDRLHEDGWELQETPDGPFELVAETIEWPMVHSQTGVSIELQLQAYEAFGRRTRNLRDICYCVVLNHGVKMTFSKINSPEWRSNLDQFRASVRDIARKGDVDG